jgi:hypothetical protein
MRPLPPKAAALSTLAARVQSFRRSDDLSLSERRELDVIAFGYLRRRQLARESAARRRDLPQLFRQVTLLRERSLVASIGSNGEAVQPWRALVGFEGRPTGDGRFIDPGAIEAASLPMPLRWTPTDLGGHQGAVIVGRIDRLVRLANGAIIAFGVIDLGSDDGREVVRLIRGRFLSGVSMDLDSTASELATLSTDPVTGKKTQASVVSTGRLRAATLLAIPAFDEARIVLDDCGCDNELTIINERKA